MAFKRENLGHFQENLGKRRNPTKSRNNKEKQESKYSGKTDPSEIESILLSVPKDQNMKNYQNLIDDLYTETKTAVATSK